MKTASGITQGTPEWHEFRAKHFPSSEASAMLSQSKHQSRNELLNQRATGKEIPVNSSLMALFERGHEAEAQARPLAESIIRDELYPVTGSIDVDGLPLSASFDGLTMLGYTCWEHKLLNKNLSEQLAVGIIPQQYKPQLEQQLLVSGAKRCLFMASEGTAETAVWAWYESDEALRQELIAGWKQFKNDLENYSPTREKEKLIGKEASGLPALKYNMEGSNIVSNAGAVLEAIKEISKQEMSRTLETDQDFADKDVFNKAVKSARAKLKQSIKDVQGEFVSYAEFEKTAKGIDSVLQKMQSQGEKAVKQAKEDKKAQLKHNGTQEILAHYDKCNLMIKPYDIVSVLCDPLIDFSGAMKNKRTIESLHGAVDDLVAITKAQINQVMDKVIPNVDYLKTKEEYKFLFADIQLHLSQSTDTFKAFVRQRICLYKEEQEKKKYDAIRLEAEIENTERDDKLRRESISRENTVPIVHRSEEDCRTEIIGCAIPHDCLHELAQWALINKIDQAAVKMLESILNKYFKG